MMLNDTDGLAETLLCVVVADEFSEKYGLRAVDILSVKGFSAQIEQMILSRHPTMMGEEARLYVERAKHIILERSKGHLVPTKTVTVVEKRLADYAVEAEILGPERAIEPDEVLRDPVMASNRIKAMELILFRCKQYLNATLNDDVVSDRSLYGFTQILQEIGAYEKMLGEEIL